MPEIGNIVKDEERKKIILVLNKVSIQDKDAFYIYRKYFSIFDRAVDVLEVMNDYELEVIIADGNNSNDINFMVDKFDWVKRYFESKGIKRGRILFSKNHPVPDSIKVVLK